ncbi:hypothetical protein Sjap_005723 [Stephania japonica]|uniref:Uncharacterized protein n=1 Tax=Stephania japonica TaxID=461633 RepID=A0AAP0K5Q3_9MAGN
MNSMLFSSFDAVLGEYFGQKMMNSAFNLGKQGSGAAAEEMKRKDRAPPPPPPVNERVPAKKGASPRFAVELDVQLALDNKTLEAIKIKGDWASKEDVIDRGIDGKLTKGNLNSKLPSQGDCASKEDVIDRNIDGKLSKGNSNSKLPSQLVANPKGLKVGMEIDLNGS